MPSPRFDAIDALRGLALVWMTVFHFVFDLNHFGYVQQDFYRDAFWTWQRTCILSLFLFCAGLGQAAAVYGGQRWARFWRRWLQVAGCALLVSVGSYLMYPRSFIYFGVLHGMVLMLVIARLTAHWGGWLWPLGLLAIASKFLAAHLLADSPWAGAFNSPWLNWLGFITHKPITEDYVPLFPWLGVMWWGVATSAWLCERQPAVLAAWRAQGLGGHLARAGRWSLSYYMVHQPIMVGALTLFAWASR